MTGKLFSIVVDGSGTDRVFRRAAGEAYWHIGMSAGLMCLMYQYIYGYDFSARKNQPFRKTCIGLFKSCINHLSTSDNTAQRPPHNAHIPWPRFGQILTKTGLDWTGSIIPVILEVENFRRQIPCSMGLSQYLIDERANGRVSRYVTQI